MKYWIKQKLEYFPSIYITFLRIWRWKHWSKDWVVTPNHDVVIEGYQRSANSFASIAFEISNKSTLKIATHSHSPAQVLQAVKWGIPALILIRNPVDAVIGDLAINQQLATRRNKTPKIITKADILSSLDRWIWFYQSISHIRDKIFIAEFQDVIKNYADVTKMFIEFSGKNFLPYDPNKYPTEDILNLSFHIGPNAERDEIKKSIGLLVRSCADNGDFDKALELYGSLGRNGQ